MPTDSHTSPPPGLTRGGSDEQEPNTGLKSGPPLMRGMDVHENINIFDTKLMLGLRVCFISSDLTANKLFPINPRTIMGPPKMSLLLEVESMSALIIEPRLILVTHTDDLGGWARADPALHHRLYSN